jgi:hypothetical protein
MACTRAAWSLGRSREREVLQLLDYRTHAASVLI